MNIDRANLETRIAPVEEFLDVFMAALKKLQLHDFIAKNQAKFLAERRRRASHLESILSLLTSQRITVFLFKMMQSFHWNNLQATVHPFLCYYKNTDGK